MNTDPIKDTDVLKKLEDWLSGRLEKLIYGFTDNQLEKGMSIISKIANEMKTTIKKELWIELGKSGTTIGATANRELDLRQGMIRITATIPYSNCDEDSQWVSGYVIAFFKKFLRNANRGSYNLVIFRVDDKEQADQEIEEFLYSNPHASSGKWFENGRA